MHFYFIYPIAKNEYSRMLCSSFAHLCTSLKCVMKSPFGMQKRKKVLFHAEYIKNVDSKGISKQIKENRKYAYAQKPTRNNEKKERETSV
jgi:hypothetical protein